MFPGKVIEPLGFTTVPGFTDHSVPLPSFGTIVPPLGNSTPPSGVIIASPLGLTTTSSASPNCSLGPGTLRLPSSSVSTGEPPFGGVTIPSGDTVLPPGMFTVPSFPGLLG